MEYFPRFPPTNDNVPMKSARHENETVKISMTFFLFIISGTNFLWFWSLWKPFFLYWKQYLQPYVLLNWSCLLYTSRGHVVFFRQLGDGLTRMIEGDKGFFKFFWVAFFHVFVLCLNYTIVTLRFKDNITHNLGLLIEVKIWKLGMHVSVLLNKN